MRNLYLFIFLIPLLCFSQQKKDWFFGAEIGNNTITSSNLESKNSFQGGFLAEYYFAKQWSILGRLKYFKTGTTNNSETGYFDGSVLNLPLNLKWEYKITNKIKGNLILGIAFNKEIKSKYYYPANENTDFSSFFADFNTGLGFSYSLNEKTKLIIGYEIFILGNNRDSKNTINILPNSTNNNLFNIGIKHNFKK